MQAWHVATQESNETRAPSRLVYTRICVCVCVGVGVCVSVCIYICAARQWPWYEVDGRPHECKPMYTTHACTVHIGGWMDGWMDALPSKKKRHSLFLNMFLFISSFISTIVYGKRLS